LRDDGKRSRGQQSAEPAVTDVIRQAHGGVADTGGEQFNQHGSNRAIHHGDEQHQVKQDGGNHHFVHLGGVGFGGITGTLEVVGNKLLEFNVLFLGVLSVQALGGVAGNSGFTNLDGSHRSRRSFNVFVAHRSARQHLLGNVAGTGELRGACRIELERAFFWISGDDHLVFGLRGGQVRVGGLGQGGENRKICQDGKQATGHDDGLATNLVGQGTKDDEKGRAQNQRVGHQNIGGRSVHLEGLRQEEKCVELTRIPDYCLAGGQANQCQDHNFKIFPLAEGFGKWRF